MPFSSSPQKNKEEMNANILFSLVAPGAIMLSSIVIYVANPTFDTLRLQKRLKKYERPLLFMLFAAVFALFAISHNVRLCGALLLLIHVLRN
jgi:hypothetical protein